MKKVGIIGGSGYIGSYTTKIFLDHGFKVKVSTTDITRKDKYQHLMKLNNAENLYISELNVEDKTALLDFVSDCELVIHGGTPFILNVQNPQTELFDPTIKGTENFLEAIKKTSSVEKVVFIASVAAWNTDFPMSANGKNLSDTFDETDTKFTSPESHPYAQAKFIANRTVEKFIVDNPNLPFEISSVSPVFVAGKSMSNREDSTSIGMQYLIKNKIAPDAFVQALYDNNVGFAIVNVEDVAKAIYNAATTKGLHGKNYLLVSETYKISDMNLMLNHHEPMGNPDIIYKNDLARKDLRMNFKSAKETLNSY